MTFENKIYNDDSFSLRKIEANRDENIDNISDSQFDKIKILELSNSIDEWEKELLFSENGFYSLKGKEVINKAKEYYKELEKFISHRIYDMGLKTLASLKMVSEIKKMKMQTILEQMQMHENQQIYNWEIQVLEQSLKSVIERAVLYKNNDNIIFSSLQNGVSILNVMAEKEAWNKKTYLGKLKIFESEFYINIINSYVKDKNLDAFLIFEKYKDKLQIEDKENIEKALEKLKNKTIAFNWVQELLSYKLPETENNVEINKIENNDIKILVKELIKEINEQNKRQKEKEIQDRNEANWEEIISVLNSEPQKAFLYIDDSLPKENQKAKENYIKNISKFGSINTDEKKFLEILKEIYSNFDEFSKKSISDYREFLSEEDFEIVSKLKEMTFDEYTFYVSDYKYIQSILPEYIAKSDSELYSVIKLLFSIKKSYASENKKEPDIETKNKLIKALFDRFKQEGKKGE